MLILSCVSVSVPIGRSLSKEFYQKSTNDIRKNGKLRAILVFRAVKEDDGKEDEK
jgi:hypothetical protein